MSAQTPSQLAVLWHNSSLDACLPDLLWDSTGIGLGNSIIKHPKALLVICQCREWQAEI